MNYMKSPLQKKKQKPNRRNVLSGGKPAERKRSSFFSSGSGTGGSSKSHGSRKSADTATKKSAFPSFAPWKVIMVSILVGICGLLYIGHVFNTQQTLTEVQQLENEYNRTMRIYEEQRLAYDRMVGPKEIYQKARERGFINAGPADQIITIER